MSHAATHVQLPTRAKTGKTWLVVTDPLDIGELTARLQLDISPEDDALLANYAAFKNALADAQRVKLERRWSRKSMGESVISDGCKGIRATLTEMFAALGPLPSAEDKTGMAMYAKRVLAWSKKSSK